MKAILKRMSLINGDTILKFGFILLCSQFFSYTLVAQNVANSNLKSDIKSEKVMPGTNQQTVSPAQETTKLEIVNVPVSNEPAPFFAPEHPGNKSPEEAKKQAEKNGVKFLNVKPESKQPAKTKK